LLSKTVENKFLWIAHPAKSWIRDPQYGGLRQKPVSHSATCFLLSKTVENKFLWIAHPAKSWIRDPLQGLTSLIPEWGTYTSQNLLRFAHTGFSSDPQLQAMLGCSSIKKPCSSCKVL
jgi:hypothetical protein